MWLAANQSSTLLAATVGKIGNYWNKVQLCLKMDEKVFTNHQGDIQMTLLELKIVIGSFIQLSQDLLGIYIV